MASPRPEAFRGRRRLPPAGRALRQRERRWVRESALCCVPMYLGTLDDIELTTKSAAWR